MCVPPLVRTVRVAHTLYVCPQFRARDAMIAELKRITDGIEAFREDTFRLQKETNKVRVDSERITQRITIVRTETEAVLNR